MLDEEGDLQAAELALGLLDGDDRAAALRRVLADPAFAAAVERWRVRFAQLFDLWPEVEPPEELIDRIDLSLGGPLPARSRRVPWPILAVISTAIAAVLLVFVAWRPVSPPAPPPERPETARAQPLLVAALNTATPVSAVFEPGSARLRLAGTPEIAADRVAQLWIIGADEVPYSLGLLGAAGTTRVLDPANARRLVDGATLAVSAEPPGGSPQPIPTGPVVATGTLRAV